MFHRPMTVLHFSIWPTYITNNAGGRNYKAAQVNATGHSAYNAPWLPSNGLHRRKWNEAQNVQTSLPQNEETPKFYCPAIVAEHYQLRRTSPFAQC